MSTLVVLRNPLPSPSSSVLMEPHWVVGQTTSPCPGTSSATTPTSFTSSAINQACLAAAPESQLSLSNSQPLQPASQDLASQLEPVPVSARLLHRALHGAKVKGSGAGFCVPRRTANDQMMSCGRAGKEERVQVLDFVEVHHPAVYVAPVTGPSHRFMGSAAP